ncbi:MAG: hypothetical protein AAB645_01720 [Patescibacteria group bacterium]
MEENEKPKNSRKKMMDCSCFGSSCGCGSCMAHRHWDYHLLHFVLGLIIILLVFWLGMQIGLFKAGAGYGGDDFGWGRHGMMYYRQTPMMYQYQLGQPNYYDNGSNPIKGSTVTPTGKAVPSPK